MSRVLKFRAWDSYQKKMIDEFQDDLYNMAHGYNGLYSSAYDEEGDFYELEVMQWTGLKDKDGQDIYEGDIVEDECDRHPLFEIRWLNDEEHATFYLKELYRTANDVWWFEHYPPSGLKVVGNVWENPELLNGGTKND